MKDSITAAIDQMIKEFEAEQSFMGCVLISKDDEVVLRNGYGFANVEWDIPNSPTTKFQIASVSKQFTAAAILLLQDRENLSIDDLVKKHLPEAPAAWDKVTIRHLLTHTSGIHTYDDVDVVEFFTPMKKIACTPQNIMEMFVNLPLEFEAGEKIAYSNSGYVVLGRIIEKISGQSLAVFMQESIFKPLGMNDSGHDEDQQIIKNRASGYAFRDGKLFNAGYMDPALLFACGDIYSTVEDLHKWAKGVFAGKLLSEASLKEMITPHMDNYAFGLTVTAEKGRRAIKHKGKTPGFKSVLTYYPSDQMIIAVLSNNETGAAAFEIARMAAAIVRGEEIILPKQRKEVEIPSEILAAYIGKYKLENGLIFEISTLSQKLMAQTKLPDEPSASMQDEVWISAETKTKFFSRERPGVEIEFFKNGNDEVSHLVLHQGTKSSKAVRK
ncbi:MAG: beta-lactamase family protein [Candidatus Obscuribacterales bacterium]|nr:beta-lactamase family protein [Candidatus Obscuribacterales bacterium]